MNILQKNGDILSQKLRGFPITNVPIAMVMYLTIFFFIHSGIGFSRVMATIILLLMFISGSLLILSTIVCYSSEDHSINWYGEILSISSGMLGIIEALVSLTALHTNDYSYYDIFNFTGYEMMIGAITILLALHFILGSGKTK